MFGCGATRHHGPWIYWDCELTSKSCMAWRAQLEDKLVFANILDKRNMERDGAPAPITRATVKDNINFG